MNALDLLPFPRKMKNKTNMKHDLKRQQTNKHECARKHIRARVKLRYSSLY